MVDQFRRALLREGPSLSDFVCNQLCGPAARRRMDLAEQFSLPGARIEVVLADSDFEIFVFFPFRARNI